MSALQRRILENLTNSFIIDRVVNPSALAHHLHREFPDESLAALTDAVTVVAKGIGVRVKEIPDGSVETTARACA